MQHSNVYALAHHRTDAGPFGKPVAYAECITLFESVRSSFADSVSQPHLRSPHADPHAGPECLSFSFANSNPHIGAEQRQPHARCVVAITKSLGSAEQQLAADTCSIGVSQPAAADIGSVGRAQLACNNAGSLSRCLLTAADCVADARSFRVAQPASNVVTIASFVGYAGRKNG